MDTGRKLPDVTLCFLLRGNEVLLAMKKRGFGKGLWNGFGGKRRGGSETVECAAVRELKEESGLTVAEEALQRVADIDFYFPANPVWDQHVHVFLVREWSGEPQETEEMRPQFFPLDAVPYGPETWPEDVKWWPRIFAGEVLDGYVRFKDAEGNAERIELVPVRRT